VTRVVSVSDFADFRVVARGLIADHVRPDAVSFCDPHLVQTSLFDGPKTLDPPPSSTELPTFRVPRRYVELAELASLYRADDRFGLLYRVLYRIAHGEAHLLDDELDQDVFALLNRGKSVRHDEHRMHAFVRFRRTELDGEPHFVAWYRPEHFIVRLTAPFFQRRFATMRWSILTPDEAVHWDLHELRYGPGTTRSEAPAEDELEELFRTYYRSTYNPARENLRLFRHHVPLAFQRDMPELTLLPELTDMATKRASKKAVDKVASTKKSEAEAAAPLVPPSRKLQDLRAAAAKCLACPLGEPATQTVFGEGAKHAKLCLVGEQPGDQEDLQGHPFVGPAGKVLDRALAELGIQRGDIYMTNAVKHFSYRPLGKKRLHQKPEWKHIEACRPWLRAELESVTPEVIVCLGATAAQSFLGRRFTVLKNRGRVFATPWAKAFLVTYHPSAILRMPSDEARDEAYAALVADLKLAQGIVQGASPKLVSPEPTTLLV
jgi:probable DNA metabolism protein